jgi:hypothetical protein
MLRDEDEKEVGEGSGRYRQHGLPFRGETRSLGLTSDASCKHKLMSAERAHTQGDEHTMYVEPHRYERARAPQHQTDTHA